MKTRFDDKIVFWPTLSTVMLGFERGKRVKLVVYVAEMTSGVLKPVVKKEEWLTLDEEGNCSPRSLLLWQAQTGVESEALAWVWINGVKTGEIRAGKYCTGQNLLDLRQALAKEVTLSSADEDLRRAETRLIPWKVSPRVAENIVRYLTGLLRCWEELARMQTDANQARLCEMRARALRVQIFTWKEISMEGDNLCR